jgi:hypothetical protein
MTCGLKFTYAIHCGFWGSTCNASATILLTSLRNEYINYACRVGLKYSQFRGRHATRRSFPLPISVSIFVLRNSDLFRDLSCSLPLVDSYCHRHIVRGIDFTFEPCKKKLDVCFTCHFLSPIVKHLANYSLSSVK